MTARVHPGLLWFGVLAAPTAWVVQLVAGYGVQEAGCAGSGLPAVLDVRTGPAIVAVSVVALLVSVAGGVAAYASRRSIGAVGDGPPSTRRAFLADAGLLASLIFAVLIVLGGIAVFFLDACDAG